MDYYGFLFCHYLLHFLFHYYCHNFYLAGMCFYHPSFLPCSHLCHFRSHLCFVPCLCNYPLTHQVLDFEIDMLRHITIMITFINTFVFFIVFEVILIVRVFTEYLITLGHLLRTNRLCAYSL